MTAPTGASRGPATSVLDCDICGQHSVRLVVLPTAPGKSPLAAAPRCWFCDADPRFQLARAA